MAGPTLVLFGATGFTAELIIESLLRSELEPILVARDPGRLAAVARRFGLEARAGSADDPGGLAKVFHGASVVMNAAGPFVATVDAVVRACLEARAHYMDVSGEARAIEIAARHHGRARNEGLTILPAAGFDVVPSDCLCAHVVRRLPDACSLRIVVSGLELVSPGSARTLAADLGQPTLVRRAGVLCEIEPGSLTRNVDLGAGPRACTAVTWGDLVTAHYSTGIPNIETYFEATPAVLATIRASRAFSSFFRLPWVRQGVERQIRWWAPKPSRDERLSRRASIVVEAENGSGRVVRSRLTTPEAYTLTAETAAEIAKRLLAGEGEPGFQTPSRLFGSDFILRFAGVSRLDLEVRA